MQPQAGRKRQQDAVRADPAWACVEIIDDSNAHQPRWRCGGCGVERTGGISVISLEMQGGNPSFNDGSGRATKRKRVMIVILMNCLMKMSLSHPCPRVL
eukprot:scaffold24003_cov27-Tisochrysis_lutea.AAC.1